MPTIGSLFDGISGFPLAGAKNGIRALWASEIESFPIQVSKLRFPDMEHYGDITMLDGGKLPPVYIITGGSPCQDLSVAGKRAGLSGERSGLYMEQIRIIKEMREATNGEYPRYMVWKNVPGAFSSNKGEDFRAVLEEAARVIDETFVVPAPPKGKWNTAGCIVGDNWSIAWRVLDAQYWGVPQRRRRIFAVADFGGLTAPEILFKREGLRRHLEESREAKESVAATAERSSGDTGNTGLAYTMLIRSGCEGGGKGPLVQEDKSATLKRENYQTLFQALYESHPQDSRVTGPHEIAPTVSRQFGTGGNNTPLVQTYQQTTGPLMANTHPGSYSGQDAYSDMFVTMGADCRNACETEELTHTLQAKPGGGISLNCTPSIRQAYSVRRLTPLECERLQGYPDGWTDLPKASDSARYKALGNSVDIECVEYVMEGIREVYEIETLLT